MGKICLSHKTAFGAWRVLRTSWFAKAPVLFGPGAPARNSGYPRTRLKASALKDCSASNLDLCLRDADRTMLVGEPIELLVPRRFRRQVARGVVLHSMGDDPPAGAVLSISEKTCIVSPELCFVQMAQTLCLEDLLKVAFEMCGYYVLDESSDRGLVRSMPLTSRAQLEVLMNKMPPMRGLAKAREVVSLVADGCASPREAALYALLCFPVRLGGCGLPRPQMNREIKLSKSTAAAFGSSFYVGDMVWPKSRVVVEYDGLLDHAEADRIARDAGRRDALVAEGYTVFVVTNRQISDPKQFFVIAKSVAKSIGHRLRIRDAAFEAKSARLRSALL